MGFFDSLFAKNKAGKNPRAASSAPAPSRASEAGGHPSLLYPPGVKTKAERLEKQNTPEQNRRELGTRIQSEKWLEAFPYALAETFQTGNAVALKYVAVCFLKLASGAAASGRMTDAERSYLTSALHLFDQVVLAGEADWDALQYRGSAHLLSAQINNDSKAADQAEKDFRKSLAIQPSDMVKRNLERVTQVRNRLK